jgi:hypothetical protein
MGVPIVEPGNKLVECELNNSVHGHTTNPQQQLIKRLGHVAALKLVPPTTCVVSSCPFIHIYPQAVEQPPKKDQNYPSHHPSEVDSQQDAKYTNDGAKVHTPLSPLAQH